MPPRDPGRVRALAGWVVALCAALAVAAAVPATSSAFTASITNSTDTAASKAVFTCADVFAGETRKRTAFFEFTLREDASTTTAADSSAQGNPGTYTGTHTKDGSSPRPCPSDPGEPYVLDGTSSRVLTSKQFAPIRGDFSIEIWFKTSARNEKLMGFESQPSGSSSNYDKHLYIDDAGHLRFAIYNSDGNTTTPISPAAVDDGLWHQAVATSSSTDGCVLYLDGAQVDTNPKTIAENFSGYWRIGQGNTGGWPSAPQGDSYFTGAVSFAGAYATVLTAAEIRSAYTIGKPAAVPGTEKTAKPQPTASAIATAMPEASASATPAATESPAPQATATATAVPGPVRSEAAPTYAPAPGSSDVSTVPDQQ